MGKHTASETEIHDDFKEQDQLIDHQGYTCNQFIKPGAHFPTAILQLNADGWYLIDNQGTRPLYFTRSKDSQAPSTIIMPMGKLLFYGYNNAEYMVHGALNQAFTMGFYGAHKPDFSDGVGVVILNPSTGNTFGTEEEPIIVHPEQYITREMVKSITWVNRQLTGELTGDEIKSLFDKDCDTGFVFEDYPYIYTIHFKMPMMLKEFLITDEDNLAFRIFYRWIDTDGVPHPPNSPPGEGGDMPQYTWTKTLIVDMQIARLEFYHGGPV